MFTLENLKFNLINYIRFIMIEEFDMPYSNGVKI